MTSNFDAAPVRAPRARSWARPATRTAALACGPWLTAAMHGAVAAESIVFIGNSFTYAYGSDVQTYRPDTVTDLNGTGIGGIPALFKPFTQQAGLDWDVSLETEPGINLDWHYDNRLGVLNQAWDHVVMHGQSTLDFAAPNDPTKISTYGGLLADVFTAANPDVDVRFMATWSRAVRFMATWSRADQTYLPTGYWYGQPITQMGIDVQAGYEVAMADNASVIDGIIPVGLAWNRAITTGVADANPYDGITPGQVDLWTFDHYHASLWGSYLEALTVFGSMTGLDPRMLGGSEMAAMDLGISADEAMALQQVAWAQLSAVPEPATGALMLAGLGVMVCVARRRQGTASADAGRHSEGAGGRV